MGDSIQGINNKVQGHIYSSSTKMLHNMNFSFMTLLNVTNLQEFGHLAIVPALFLGFFIQLLTFVSAESVNTYISELLSIQSSKKYNWNQYNAHPSTTFNHESSKPISNVKHQKQAPYRQKYALLSTVLCLPHLGRRPCQFRPKLSRILHGRTLWPCRLTKRREVDALRLLRHV